MGNAQIINEASNIIENNFNKNKCNSILEKKILNEFYFLKEILLTNKNKNGYLSIETDDYSKLYEKIYKTSVSINHRTKMLRLIKWYRMGLETERAFKNDIEIESNNNFSQPRSPKFNTKSSNKSISIIPLDKSQYGLFGSSKSSSASENNWEKNNIKKKKNSCILSKSENNLIKYSPSKKVFSNPHINENKIISNEKNISILFAQNEKCNFTIHVERNLLKFSLNNKSKFLERVSKGPPDCFRWLSWKICADLSSNIKEEVFDYFINSKIINEDTNVQIKKDLNRTLSDYPIFNLPEIQDYLYKVLKAFAIMDEEVLYCQGMNFIAGFILIISDFKIVESFYMLTFLFSNETFGLPVGGTISSSIRGFFSNDFPTLKFYLFVFNYHFKKKFPILNKHLLALEIPEEVWISKWFHTLFTICLPLHAVARLWDCLLSIGLDFLINFSLALLKKKENEILKLDDIIQILDFFKLNFHNENLDVEEIINDAKKISIDKANLIILKKEYEKEFSIDFSKLNIIYDLNPLILQKEICLDTCKCNHDPDAANISDSNYIGISDIDPNISVFDISIANDPYEEELHKKKVNSIEHVNVSNFLKSTNAGTTGTTNGNFKFISGASGVTTPTVTKIEVENDEIDEYSICNEFYTNEISLQFQVNSQINMHTIKSKDIGINRIYK